MFLRMLILVRWKYFYIEYIFIFNGGKQSVESTLTDNLPYIPLCYVYGKSLSLIKKKQTKTKHIALKLFILLKKKKNTYDLEQKRKFMTLNPRLSQYNSKV